ncbi:hypothetical protein ASPZODRAFT_156288 [Penicilliopsis zonata CBS 506.65]|uniref:Programmed cell death protein 2 C-terminal domain-containing protein n=1 Tax=Penicilliopsis zonata CBS 506.65 TaxID=1073090 RepID=A0A1L9SW40_9EURO|nr:hypothetical protein ASPZODRAFT_156288 [Penicilliopsis zonata CBS 506.65]OJJ51396.1 hypothetical protein ASPZODRAFT_156288 [Penicilliopsis zonata CBS 506.65]
MDPYDSDSSGLEDEGDYTETGVLLGYASEEVLDDSVSHLGGWPTWLDDKTPPPGKFANCKVCNQPMILLLELNGDLPENFPNDERRLYIFGCPRKACNKKPGSIRALRATRKLKADSTRSKASQQDKKAEGESQRSQETQPAPPKQDIGASLFGASPLTGGLSSNVNPFSSSTSSAAPTNPFAAPSSTANTLPPTQLFKPESVPATPATLAESFADKVRVSSPPPTTKAPETDGPQLPWPAQSDFPKPYPHYYLDAEYETISRPSTPTIPENVTVEAMEEDDGSAGASADLKDTFESDLDKAFIRFSTRLSHNPEQVLRYEFRGSALLYSRTDEVGKRLHDNKGAAGPGGARVTTTSSYANRIPRCEHCGHERVFELQLVPHAISMLEEGREGLGLGAKEDTGMEWGTIILGVCGKNCGPDQLHAVGWREEWTGVQWEEAK